MFILTNIDTNQDLVQVFDTQDGTNDIVRLSIVAPNVTNKGMKIYGLGKISQRLKPTATPIPSLGVYVDAIEAKEAFATYYQKHGMTREQARMRVGLAM